MNTKPSQGALNAAYEIILNGFGDTGQADEQAKFLAKIIDQHTAAPELLEACQEFLRFADLPNECVPRGDYIRYQVSAISAARAAIAKAEGREA